MITLSNTGSGSRNTFLDTVTCGLSGDGTLSLSDYAGSIPAAFFMNIHRMSHPEICFVVARCLLGDEIDSGVLKEIIYSAYDFPLPLKEVSEKLFTFDCSMVPSGSYMEQGGMFMSSLIAYLRKSIGDTRAVTALVYATPQSGLVLARLFSRMPSVRAICIFTRGTLDRTLASAMQSMGTDIFPVEISSDLPGCIKLVSDAQSDRELTERVFLTAVMPSNPAITLTRVFQYFQAYAQFVAIRKSKNKTGDSIFRKGLVFLIPSTMRASVDAARVAESLGIPDSRFVVFSPSEVRDPSLLLSAEEFGILIPEIQTEIFANEERQISHVDRIPATFPAFKRYILNKLK